MQDDPQSETPPVSKTRFAFPKTPQEYQECNDRELDDILSPNGTDEVLPPDKCWTDYTPQDFLRIIDRWKALPSLIRIAIDRAQRQPEWNESNEKRGAFAVLADQWAEALEMAAMKHELRWNVFKPAARALLWRPWNIPSPPPSGHFQFRIWLPSVDVAEQLRTIYKYELEVGQTPIAKGSSPKTGSAKGGKRAGRRRLAEEHPDKVEQYNGLLDRWEKMKDEGDNRWKCCDRWNREHKGNDAKPKTIENAQVFFRKYPELRKALSPDKLDE